MSKRLGTNGKEIFPDYYDIDIDALTEGVDKHISDVLDTVTTECTDSCYGFWRDQNADFSETYPFFKKVYENDQSAYYDGMFYNYLSDLYELYKTYYREYGMDNKNILNALLSPYAKKLLFIPDIMNNLEQGGISGDYLFNGKFEAFNRAFEIDKYTVPLGCIVMDAFLEKSDTLPIRAMGTEVADKFVDHILSHSEMDSNACAIINMIFNEYTDLKEKYSERVEEELKNFTIGIIKTDNRGIDYIGCDGNGDKFIFVEDKDKWVVDGGPKWEAWNGRIFYRLTDSVNDALFTALTGRDKNDGGEIYYATTNDFDYKKSEIFYAKSIKDTPVKINDPSEIARKYLHDHIRSGDAIEKSDDRILLPTPNKKKKDKGKDDR